MGADEEILFLFVLGIFLLTVWQTCLPREGGDLQEEIGVTVNPQGHQDGSGSVEQVSCQHTPENLIWDTKWSCGTRMQRSSDVGPLALEGETEQEVRLHCRNCILYVYLLGFFDPLLFVLFYIHIGGRSSHALMCFYKNPPE